MCGGYMKAMVYEHKANKGKELLQRILSAARSSSNAALLRKFLSSLSNESENVSKQMVATSNNLHEW